MSLRGIDISNHNSWPFNSSTEYYYKDAQFVICKASQGTHFTDHTFKNAIERVLKDGKLGGAYHYAESSNPEDQADYFLNIVGPYVKKIVLALDWEGQDNGAFGTGSDIPRRFVERVHEKTGVYPILYSGIQGIQKDFSGLYDKCKLWFAGYPTPQATGWDPPNFLDSYKSGITPWTYETLWIWQYSSANGCDKNIGNLTEQDWMAVATGSGSTGFYGWSSSSTAEDPRDKFVSEAASHINKDGKQWTFDNTNLSSGAGWCVAFVCAVAKACGFAGVILPDNIYVADDYSYQTVEKYGGTYLDRGSTPERGDLINFPPGWFRAAGVPAEYDSGHMGIVESVDDNTIHTIEGNYGDKLQRVNRPRNGKYYYIRPDWSKVTTFLPTSDMSISESAGPLYTTSSTRADATIREVGYLDKLGEPSINKTDVKLMVINYTSLLAEFAGLFSTGGSNSGSLTDTTTGSPDNIDALETTPRQIVEYLVGKGLNTAAAIGIIANIKGESSFNLGAIGDNGTSFGLCQWHDSRGDAMKAACGGGSNWKNNLTGQLDYLWQELNGSYSHVLSAIQTVPNTLEGAKQASEVWTRKYEIPADVDNVVAQRKQWAEEYWSQIIVNTNSSYGTSTSGVFSSVSSAITSASSSIKGLSRKGIEEIPSILPGAYPEQSGILADTTVYDTINWGEPCIRVYNVWVAKGKKSNHSIATIDNFYLVAVRPMFGDVGDAIKITLEGNITLDCIIGDTKGKDAPSPYGHIYGGKVSLVEWESVSPIDAPKLNSILKDMGIHGRKVVSIANYGRYC